MTEIQDILSLLSVRRYAEAEAACRQQLAEQNSSEVLYYLAVSLAEQGKKEEAASSYEAALAGMPERADIAYNYGVLCQKTGEILKAQMLWERAVAADPDLLPAWLNLGRLTGEVGPYEEVLKRQPDHPQALLALAVLTAQGGLWEPAMRYLSPLLEKDDVPPQAYDVLGKIRKATNDIEGAEEAYRSGIARYPDYAELHFSLANLLLLQERYAEGFESYEWRLKRPAAPHPDFPMPTYIGGDLRGKSILLWGDQGIGDHIQFLRYVKWLGAEKVVVYLQPALCRLAETAGENVAAVPFGEIPPPCDCHAPLMSLPHLMNKTQPFYEGPYLSAAGGEVSSLIRSGERKKIGLIWSGNPLFPTNKNRSCPPEMLQAIIEAVPADFYTLQKGEAGCAAQEGGCLAELVTDLGPDLSDFADTAACMCALDAVVTVDTAAAHLAGALGLPVYILVSALEKDWRWGLSGTSNAWYPAASLIRQTEPGDWQGALGGLTLDLKGLVRG